MIYPKTKKDPVVGTPRLSKPDSDRINNTSISNTKNRGIESIAKNDSISATKQYFQKNPLVKNTSQYTEEANDLVNRKIKNNAALAGNKAANSARVKGGNAAGQVDTYISRVGSRAAFSVRRKSVEKDLGRFSNTQSMSVGGAIDPPGYKSNKISIKENGLASANPYPKTRTMSTDSKTGKEMISVKDSNGKTIIHKENRSPNGAKESNRFKSDSTAYSEASKFDESRFNIGKVASKTFKPKPVVKSKKGMKMVDTKSADCGCGSHSDKMQQGGAIAPQTVSPQTMAQGYIRNPANGIMGAAYNMVKDSRAKAKQQQAKPKQPVGGYNTFRGAALASASEQAVRKANSTPGMYARGGEMPSIDEESPIRNNK